MDDNRKSFLKLPFRAGKITGLPKDPTTAPATLRLSQDFSAQETKAMRNAKRSHKEWGFFIHFTEAGRLLPGALIEGVSEEEWIPRDAYTSAQQQDASIHGMIHTHLGTSPFSHNKIGFFLDLDVALSICLNSRNEYFLMLRTARTTPPRPGIFRDAIERYGEIARELTITAIISHDLSPKSAIGKALYDTALVGAMTEVCKKYNIALYTGKVGTMVQKVT